MRILLGIFGWAAASLLATPSWAADGELQEWWDGAGNARFSDRAYYADGVSIADGPCSLDVEEGIFVPLYGGRGPVPEKVVGLAFVGNASLEVGFDRSQDATAFSNHLAMRTDTDRDALKKIAHQEEAFRSPVSRAVFYSADDSLGEVLVGLSPVGSGVMLEQGEDGVDEVFVVTPSEGRIRAHAAVRRFAPERRVLLERAGLAPLDMIRMDRFSQEKLNGDASETGWVADFLTEQRFGVALGTDRVLGDTSPDRWLTCFRDGSGMEDLGLRNVVFSHGLDRDDAYHMQVFGGRPFGWGEEGRPEDHMPRPVVEPVFADTRVLLRPFRRRYIKNDVESSLRVRSRRDGVGYALMELPRHENREGKFEFAGFETADGQELEWIEIKSEVADERRSRERLKLDRESDEILLLEVERLDRLQALVVLPQVLNEGEEVELRFTWKGQWMFGGYTQAQGKYTPTGQTTGYVNLLPNFLPRFDDGLWSFRTQVEYPGSYGLDIALAGDTTFAEEDEESLWWKVVSEGENVRRPGIAVGKWLQYAEGPSRNMPAVRVHLFRKEKRSLQEFPPEVRRVLSFLDRFLPIYPFGEMEIFQGADTLTQAGSTRSQQGLVEVAQLQTESGVGSQTRIEKYDPFLGQILLSRAIGRQYWGQILQPASAEDEWIAKALPETFAAFYLRNVHGPIKYRERMKNIRELLQDASEIENFTGMRILEGNSHALSRAASTARYAPNISRYYGLYVMAEMLRLRIGDQAYFRALDGLAEELSGGLVSTDQLRQAFEASSGSELADFFDYWIHGGFIPRLHLDYMVEDAGDGLVRVKGCYRSDVPFGTIHVHTRMRSSDSKPMLERLIAVEDGRGPFEWLVPRTDPILEVDPWGFILAYERGVEQVDELSCEPS
ncbi:MAG: hypothetical protein VXW32_16590 [Myxococcota bacterium]|nr:hypothetical protein [Myxococcota bacterium]